MVPIRLESDQERRGSAGKELQNYYIDYSRAWTEQPQKTTVAIY